MARRRPSGDERVADPFHCSGIDSEPFAKMRTPGLPGVAASRICLSTAGTAHPSRRVRPSAKGPIVNERNRTSRKSPIIQARWGLPQRSGRGGRRFKSCHSDQRLALPEISPSMKPSKIGRTRALVQRASWLTLVDDSNALCRSAAWQRRRVRVALTYRLVGFGMPIEPSVPRDEGWRAQDEAPSCQRLRAPLLRWIRLA
jgi:hypothetical protein